MNDTSEKFIKTEKLLNVILIIMYLVIAACVFVSGGICSYPLHENYFDLSVLNIFAIISFALLLLWNIGNAIIQLFVKNDKYHKYSTMISIILILIQFAFTVLSIFLHPAEREIMVYVAIFCVTLVFEVIKLVKCTKKLKTKDNL